MDGDRRAYTQWTIERFGATERGDRRRTQRLIVMAADIRADPQGSLPHQCGNWPKTKAACRLLPLNKRVLRGLRREQLETPPVLRYEWS